MKLIVLLAVFMAALAPAHAVAEEPAWRMGVYGWIAGLDGTVGVSDPGGPGIGGRLEGTFGQLSDHMELGGAMFYADWRRDKVSVFGDWSFFKVESEAASPFGVLSGGIDAEVKGYVLQVAAGYEIDRRGTSVADVFGGIRYFDLEGKVGLRPGVLAARTASQDDNWADGIVGLRWRTRLSDRWSLGLYGDLGAGGSDFTWQASATASYEFSWGSVIGGWRYLYVDYDNDTMRIDAALTGPFLGALFSF